MSDNGPQYTSAEFKSFVASYGIQHITSSPLYSQSNGLAEKAVQTVKNLMKKCKESGDDVYLSLLDLRNTPRDEMIGSPMQRLMGRRAKTLLPISDNLRKPTTVQPETVSSRLMEYRQKQKYYYDQGAKEQDQCQPGDTVRIHSPEGWKPAEFVKNADKPRSYIVKAGSGRLYRRNNRMLLKTKEEPHVIPTSECAIPPVMNPSNIPLCASPKTEIPKAISKPSSPSCQSVPTMQPSLGKDTIQRTKSGREIKKPKYLEDYSV